MTVHIDREGILETVSAALGEVVQIAFFSIFWAENDGEFFGREAGKLGSFVQISATGGRAMGTSDARYEKGAPEDNTFATVNQHSRRFTITLRCESDAADAQDDAHELLEQVRTRLEESEVYIDMLLSKRVSVLASGDVQDVPAVWDGRKVTGAILTLDCMSLTTETDSATVQVDGGTSRGGDFFRGVEYIGKVEP